MTTCVVDGNSLLHRSYHALAGSGLRTREGTPSWAIKGLWNHLCSAVDRAGADEVVVAFDAGRTSRHTAYPDYKAGRADKPADLTAQLDAAPEHLRAAGLRVVTEDGYEADDIVAAVARQRSAAGADVVIVTSDRDAFSLINTRVRVLRVINGGPDAWPMLTVDRLPLLVGVRPDQYLAYAALRGDASDNLPGVPGIGEKTAAALLRGLDTHGITLAEAIDDADDGSDLLARIIGKARVGKLLSDQGRTNLARNLNLMAALPVAANVDLSGASLPLDTDTLVAELSAWSMASVIDRATAVLCAGAPAAPATEVAVDDGWVSGDDLWAFAPDGGAAAAPPAPSDDGQLTFGLT